MLVRPGQLGQELAHALHLFHLNRAKLSELLWILSMVAKCVVLHRYPWEWNHACAVIEEGHESGGIGLQRKVNQIEH